MKTRMFRGARVFACLLVLWEGHSAFVPENSSSSNSIVPHHNDLDVVVANEDVVESTNTITFPLIPYHVMQRTRRGLSNNDDSILTEGPRRRTEAAQVGALYHGYGTHYMDLWCGTPPQRQTVIVDTGSGVTAFPCSQCRNCGSPEYHIDAYFDERASSTFQKAPCNQCSSRGHCNKQSQECRLGMSYQEGSSWNAYEAIDTCYVGGYHNTAIVIDDNGTEDIDPGHASAFSFPLQFGCQTSITGLFKTQLADGIMGMENAKSSFWHQMYNAHKIDKKSFSLCFSRPEKATRQGTEAGAMTLGGADTRLHQTPMVYTTTKGTNSDDGFFSVHVRAIYLRESKGGENALSVNDVKKNNARLINLNRPENTLNLGGVIVDSGTTDTYWNSQLRSALSETFKQLSGGMKWNHDKTPMTLQAVADLPTILLQLNGDEELNKRVAQEFGNSDPNRVAGLAGDLDKDHPYDVIVAIPASHYFECEKGTCVNRFYATEVNGNVLGANSMMGHDILFDAENGRIGWAESSCDYTKLVTENGYSDVLAGADLVPVNDSVALQQQEQQMEKQEEEKEVIDEAMAEEEDETYDDGGEGDDGSDDYEDDEDDSDDEPSNNEKKAKPSNGGDSGQEVHESETPGNDIQKAIAKHCTGLVCSGGLIVTLLISFALCFGCYRCFCVAKNKSKRPLVFPEVELSNGGSGYKDEFLDEEGDEEEDDDAEYGVTANSTYKDA